MRMVMESRRETRKVMSTPKTMTPVRIRVDRREFSGETAVPTKNMEIIARMVGNAPPWNGKQISFLYKKYKLIFYDK